MPLHTAERIVELAALAHAAAIVGGAVAGATAGWMSKRNSILAMCAGMVGMIGGLWLGSLTGNWFYGANGASIVTGLRSLMAAIGAGLVGALPAAFFVGGGITFIALRHVRQRPPPYRTGAKSIGFGLLAGLLAAVASVLA